MKSNEAKKSALAAVPAPVPGHPADEDDAAPPAPLPKAGLLPTGLSRAMVISTTFLSITAVVVGLVSGRFTLVPVPNSPNAMAYRIDHLTGEVAFCSSVQCSPVSTRQD